MDGEPWRLVCEVVDLIESLAEKVVMYVRSLCVMMRH